MDYSARKVFFQQKNPPQQSNLHLNTVTDHERVDADYVIIQNLVQGH